MLENLEIFDQGDVYRQKDRKTERKKDKNTVKYCGFTLL